MAPGDGGNFAQGKTLDTVEKKSFAVGAAGAAERGLDQGDQLVGVRGLLRSGNAAIGDGAFAGPTLVGLMELQSNFVGGLHILAAAAVFEMQMRGRLKFLQARRHLV